MTGVWGTPAWRTLRLQIFQRDGWRCQLRLPGCAGFDGRRLPPERLHLDHVQPRQRGGSDHPDNLRTLCAGCNLRRGRR